LFFIELRVLSPTLVALKLGPEESLFGNLVGVGYLLELR
jgi:hypothetical protein